jgi:hypothetical protein
VTFRSSPVASTLQSWSWSEKVGLKGKTGNHTRTLLSLDATIISFSIPDIRSIKRTRGKQRNLEREDEYLLACCGESTSAMRIEMRRIDRGIVVVPGYEEGGGLHFVWSN